MKNFTLLNFFEFLWRKIKCRCKRQEQVYIVKVTTDKETFTKKVMSSK